MVGPRCDFLIEKPQYDPAIVTQPSIPKPVGAHFLRLPVDRSVDLDDCSVRHASEINGPAVYVGLPAELEFPQATAPQQIPHRDFGGRLHLPQLTADFLAPSAGAMSRHSLTPSREAATASPAETGEEIMTYLQGLVKVSLDRPFFDLRPWGGGACVSYAPL